MIISTTDTSLGVSGKINRLRANEIKKVLDSVCKMHEAENFGVVVRTSAASIPDEQLIADFKKLIVFLMQLWKNRRIHSFIQSFTKATRITL